MGDREEEAVVLKVSLVQDWGDLELQVKEIMEEMVVEMVAIVLVVVEVVLVVLGKVRPQTPFLV
jgi:hypothetical protein